jgi:hypothetical protein
VILTHESLGVVAGVISIAAYALYIVGIYWFGRQIRPNKITWSILAFVGALLAESYWSAGARATFWIALFNFLGAFIVALISFGKRGESEWESVWNKICLVGAIISIGVRVLFWDHPDYSVIFNMVIDLFGILPTARKAYRDPETEGDGIAWGITVVASLFSVAAVENWRLAEYAVWSYPIYLLLLNGLVLLFITKNKKCKLAIKSVLCWINPAKN